MTQGKENFRTVKKGNAASLRTKCIFSKVVSDPDVQTRIQMFKLLHQFLTCAFLFHLFRICLMRRTLTLKNAGYIKRMRIRIPTLWPDPSSFRLELPTLYGRSLVLCKRNLSHKVPGALLISRIMNLILIESGSFLEIESGSFLDMGDRNFPTAIKILACFT
jgi:hypothetical protein